MERKIRRRGCNRVYIERHLRGLSRLRITRRICLRYHRGNGALTKCIHFCGRQRNRICRPGGRYYFGHRSSILAREDGRNYCTSLACHRNDTASGRSFSVRRAIRDARA